MNIQEIKTLGALKKVGYISKKIKTEQDRFDLAASFQKTIIEIF